MEQKKDKPTTAMDVERMFGDKIDIHTHIMPGRCGVEDRIKANEFLGVSKCVLLTFPPESKPMFPGAQFLPEDAYEATKAHPDKFKWLCNIVPDGTKETDKKLQRYYEMGASGVGEFSTKLRFDDPIMERFFSCCEELGMVFLFHMAPENAPRFYGIVDDPRMPGLEYALKKHPNMKFFGHSQPFWFEISKTDEQNPDARNSFPYGKVVDGRVSYLMRKYPNLYGDLSANSGGNAIMRDPEYGFSFLEEFSDRLMFGTDWCGGVYRYGLASWLDFHMSGKRIDREVYEKICYKNAERVFWGRI